jgi:predicted Zn-dependent protease
MTPLVASLRLFGLALARLLGLGAVLMFLGGCYTNPVTGRQSLVLISQGEELSLGQQSFAEISRAETVSRDATQNIRVRRIGERIAQVVGEQMPNAKWEFVVFDSPQANAFALPGGKVGVYTGLLRLTENDSELAIVMGHEIGHVIARHGAERMSEAMLISGIGAVSAAAIENKTDAKTKDLFLLAYGGATTVARVLPHSRGNESEADKMGAIYAARAGYDPRAALSFWQKMAGQKTGAGGSPAWLSTHPSDQKRIADLQAFMAVAVPLYEASRAKSP